MFQHSQRMNALVRVERVLSVISSTCGMPRCSIVFCNWCTDLVSSMGAIQCVTASQLPVATEAAAMTP